MGSSCLPALYAKMPRVLTRLYNQVVREPIARIDRFQQEVPATRRSPSFKTVTAAITVAVMLTVLNFWVLRGKFGILLTGAISPWLEGMADGETRALLLQIRPLYRHVSWSLGCLLFYFVIPAVIVVGVFREPLSNFGISTRGFVRHLPFYLMLFLPVLGSVILASYTGAFQKTYPFYHNPLAIWDLVLWEFFYCLQFFALEFFFRGFMIHAMKYRMGSMAVLAMVVPYCMIHFQKPMAEALGAIVAGTVLGILSLRTNTIWGGVFIHSSVAIAMDLASLIQRGIVF